MAKRKRSTFTPDFKTEVVLEALRGESSQAALCRKPHNLSDEQLPSGSCSSLKMRSLCLPPRIC